MTHNEKEAQLKVEVSKFKMAGCPLPPGFLVGVASSSYQVEGAAFQDGKGESCMDRYAKIQPNWNMDSSNGETACDSYNKIEIDLDLLQDLGVDFYRFSISWTRIAPNGDVKAGINKAGVEYYHKIIKGLIERKIIPMVTIFHWDLPQQLQDLGGWTNRVVVNFFVEYARFLFNEYGQMVKYWYTVNEPQLVGLFGYGGGPIGGPPYPPGVVAPGIGDYLAQHYQLLAHAHAYQIYQTEFKQQQKGQIGLTLQVFWAKPKTNSEADREAAKRSLLFELDALLHPLVKGDYPPELREIIDTKSFSEGRVVSRLPVFSPEEVQLIKDSFDFIGINHYSTFVVSDGLVGPIPSQSYDTGVIKEMDPNAKLPGVDWLAHEPEGIRNSLNYIRENYGTFPIYIAENGCDDPSGLHDIHRIEFIKEYFRNVIEAVNDGCNVLGYTIWSFLDSYEWCGGYLLKFGIYHVDFESNDKKRTPKDSVKLVKEILKTRSIPS